MPALLSSRVARLAGHRAAHDVLTGPQRRADLLAHLAGLPDPRSRRGRRYRLATLMAIAVCAVMSGARSMAAIAEWAADTCPEILQILGVRADPWTGQVHAPAEKTLRQVLTRIDGDALDAAIGSWLAGLIPPAAPVVAAPTPRQLWRAVAVDGKTLRGSGPPGGRSTCWPRSITMPALYWPNGRSRVRATRSPRSCRWWPGWT